MAEQNVSGRGYNKSMTTTQDIDDPTMYEDYYSCDLAISITNIKAKNAHHAEAVMQTFIDEIGKIMVDELSWDDAQWGIITNKFIPELQCWVEE
jgi:hypothetical protein